MTNKEAFDKWLKENRPAEVANDGQWGVWRAACEWQKQQQGEPVAYTFERKHGIAWLKGLSDCHPVGEVRNIAPLYLAAPTIPEGWIEEIMNIVRSYGSNKTNAELLAMLTAAPTPDTPVKTYTGGKPNYCKPEE